MSLIPAFDASASPAELRRMAMVGAEFDLVTRDLSFIDSAMLQLIMKNMVSLGIPLSSELSAIPDQRVIRVGKGTPIDPINIHPFFGGRDFLKIETSTDILMLCNVAWAWGKVLEGKEPLLSSMTLSPENENEDLWNEKIRTSGAKVVIVMGHDDFPPEKIVKDDFVAIKMQEVYPGILVRRNYLEEIEPLLKERNSPLLEVLSVLRCVSGINQFYPIANPQPQGLFFEAVLPRPS